MSILPGGRAEKDGEIENVPGSRQEPGVCTDPIKDKQLNVSIELNYQEKESR